MTETPEKIALVTGASRGLGAALAEELAPRFHVIAVAKTVGALEELDDRIKAKGGSATLAPMDVTVPEAMAQLCRSIYDRWGGIDLWAHTAIHAAPLSVAVSKRLLWEAPGLSPEAVERKETALHEHIMPMPDAIEGPVSHVERRAPKWSGRVSRDWPDWPE